MIKKIDGIIDRCAPSMIGHGDHGLYVLLVGSHMIYWLPGAREAYAPVHGRPTSANDSLVALTQAGDHVSFEVEGVRGKAGTLRNWTLETRLLGQPMREVTPPAETITDSWPLRTLPSSAER